MNIHFWTQIQAMMEQLLNPDMLFIMNILMQRRER